jgi:hypothetical protein
MTVLKLSISGVGLKDEDDENVHLRKFHVYTVHLENNHCFSPTDAQLDSLKNNLNLH